MGLAWTLLLLLPVVVGAYWVARHGLRLPAGSPRGLGAAVLGWAWLTIGMQSLGALGLLQRGPVATWSLLGLGIGIAFRIRVKGPPDQQHTRSGERLGLVAVIALGFAIWAAMSLGIASLMDPVKVISDGPIYHLYFAVRWWKAGQLELVPIPFAESAATYFPANGELWFTWLLIGWDGVLLAKVGQAPFFMLACWSSYAMARRLGAGRGAAILATTWFATCSPLLIFNFEPNVDTIFTAGYLASTFFLLRYGLDGRGVRELALSGLAAGLSWGCKPTGLVFVPPLLMFASVVIFRNRDLRLGSRLRHLLILGLGVLATLGFWLARNLWWTGSPIYPVHLSVFGQVIFPGWYQRSVMERSQFYIPIEHVEILADILLTVFDPRLIPIWIAALLGVGTIGLDRGTRGWILSIAAMAVLNIVLYWVVIPYRTQQRFFLQGIGLAVVPLAGLFQRVRLLRWPGLLLLAVHVLTPLFWPIEGTLSRLPTASETADLPKGLFSRDVPTNVPAPVPVLTFVGLLGEFLLHPKGLPFLTFHLWLCLGSFATAWAWSRWIGRSTTERILAAFGASLALLAGSVALYELKRLGPRPHYPVFVDYQVAWSRLEALSPPEGIRIAYTGTGIPYYLMGSNLRNEVLYVNVDDHPGWLLHDYHLTAASRGEPVLWPSPRPAWDRLRPDRRAWLRNLERERIDYLVVAGAKPREYPQGLDSEEFPIERQWAESDPAHFVPVYGVKPPDPEMKIFRFRPHGSTDRVPARH